MSEILPPPLLPSTALAGVRTGGAVALLGRGPYSALVADLRNSPRVRFAGVVLLGALGLLVAYVAQIRHRQAEDAADTPADEPSAPVELDRFSARLEKSNDEERLTVSLRLRAGSGGPIECYLFIVARTERGSPRPWAIWPAESPGMAISAGGHFHAAHPASGHPLSLGSGWERVEAVLPRTPGQPPFDSVSVYVVGESGNVLLERPFAL